MLHNIQATLKRLEGFGNVAIQVFDNGVMVYEETVAYPLLDLPPYQQAVEVRGRAEERAGQLKEEYKEKDYRREYNEVLDMLLEKIKVPDTISFEDDFMLLMALKFAISSIIKKIGGNNNNV